MGSALPIVYTLRGKRGKERKEKETYYPNNTQKNIENFQPMTVHPLDLIAKYL
jgi:hypothetical protein